MWAMKRGTSAGIMRRPTVMQLHMANVPAQRMWRQNVFVSVKGDKMEMWSLLWTFVIISLLLLFLLQLFVSKYVYECCSI